MVLLIQVHGVDLLCRYRRRDVLLISFHLHQQLVQLRFLIVHEANLHYLRMERSKYHGCRASERQLSLDSRPLFLPLLFEYRLMEKLLLVIGRSSKQLKRKIDLWRHQLRDEESYNHFRFLFGHSDL